jgi:hypothetical protein
MDEKTNRQILEHLRKIEHSSAAIALLLNGSAGDFPEERQSWLRDGKCLECAQSIEPSEKSVRGCHERCYRRIKRRIEDGLITEHAAISSGHLYYAEPTGRPPTKSAIDTVIKNEIAESIKLEQKTAAKRATSKTPEKRKP